MAVVIMCAITVITIVGSIFYMYFTCFKVSDLIARKIEVVGYILLVAVIIWEFIIKNILLNDFYLTDSYYTVEKINYIYILIQKICNSLNIDTSTVSHFFELKQSDYLSMQLLTTDIIESALQILSTIFIAIGRLQELKNNREQRTVDKTK